MDYGGIIKRSWQITWRYKALWVLGIFAGVSGCTGSGGSSGGGGGNSGFDGSQSGDFGEFGRFWSDVDQYVPLIIGIGVLLFIVGIVWAVFSVAARGGLVAGVNTIEDSGTQPPLGELWSAGFSRFWSLVGLDIMLALPLVAVGLTMLVLVFVPIAGTLFAGGEPGPEILAPMCGGFAIGLPLLLVGSFILGIMRLVAQRYVMLGGQGAVEAARNSWRFFRARFKDSAIMWLLNAVLNIGASVVLAIPAFIVGLLVAIPAVTAVRGGDMGALAVAIPVALVLFLLLGIAYSAVWGTFTSALWTVFFRRVSGLGDAAAAQAPAAPSMSGPPIAPAPSPYAPAPQPPQAPAPPYAPAPQPPQPPAPTDG